MIIVDEWPTGARAMAIILVEKMQLDKVSCTSNSIWEEDTAQQKYESIFVRMIDLFFLLQCIVKGYEFTKDWVAR